MRGARQATAAAARIGVLSEPPADPFGEHARPRFHADMQLLGGRFRFESDDARLLRIVRRAYAALPSHRFRATPPQLLLRLVLADAHEARADRNEPPRVRPLAGGGLLCGAMDGASFVALSPQRRAGLIVVAPAMLDYPYHLRYELIEFAAYVLAARVQKLSPLHAACVGRSGRGILLMGPSGSGKSTIALHCLLEGMEFLAEDSVLVHPPGMRATGVANFLHVRPDSLRFLSDTRLERAVRDSPVIQRRSGVEKFEIDLRRARYHLAGAPLRISALVFVSSAAAGDRPLLAPVPPPALARRLAATQQYAAHQPGWPEFLRQAARLPAFELRRAPHPHGAVEALESLLGSAPSGRRRAGRGRDLR